MSYKKKVDKNQAKIVKHLRLLGYNVKHTHTIPNFCDIIIGRSKTLCYVEIKNDSDLPAKFWDMNEQEKLKYLESKLTKGEREFYEKEVLPFNLPYILDVTAERIDAKFKQILDERKK